MAYVYAALTLRHRLRLALRGHRARLGRCFVHTVIDDYSRVAYGTEFAFG